jgi:hypothetical protein
VIPCGRITVTLSIIGQLVAALDRRETVSFPWTKCSVFVRIKTAIEA